MREQIQSVSPWCSAGSPWPRTASATGSTTHLPVASDVDRTPMSLLFELYVNPRHWISQMLVDKSDVSPFMGLEVGRGRRVSVCADLLPLLLDRRRHRMQVGIFPPGASSPSKGLFDPRNQVPGMLRRATHRSLRLPVRGRRSRWRSFLLSRPAAMFPRRPAAASPLDGPLPAQRLPADLHGHGRGSTTPRSTLRARCCVRGPASASRSPRCGCIWCTSTRRPAPRWNASCPEYWRSSGSNSHHSTSNLYGHLLATTVGRPEPLCYMPGPARRVEAAIRLIKPPRPPFSWKWNYRN